MHRFDTFSKPLQEFQVKTKIGGYLSICAGCMIIYLLLSEVMFFLELEQKDEMVIDLNQDTKTFKMHLDLWLPELPCAVVALNLVHVKNQDNVMHVGHTILKQRWGKDQKSGEWVELGKPIRGGLHRISASSGEFNDNLMRNLGNQAVEGLSHSTRKQRCHSCYGALSDEDDCCNTCESVKEAFKRHNWELPTDHTVEQCADEEYDSRPAWAAEGCKITSRSVARKVPAYLQIGLAHDFNKNFLHQSFIDKAQQGYISFTHTIDRLLFGSAFPGYIPVLDGMEQKHEHVPLIESWSEEKLESQSEHWQYDLHLIPTDFVTAFGQVIESHQYSATHFVKGLNVVQRHRDLPAAGIYLKYEFTAFRVRWIQNYKSVSHFLTNICAILGGIYAFFSMLDNMFFQLSKSMKGSGERALNL
mmetsp:Transcript_1107/g.2378  ORF Transcript_1107/g.2378 Transcript_1107/m.2378 type:complete len:416 (+) Transcript_1107:188-1435(+)|eukprot:CAMPEP_0178998128 /NCGR_PEP_ID=MMETSP0795-20121207/9354_1 /TAXON_ID=88552 /ORGANISM="Amoebophrya sp., Strain Ameob2" /LENGTH=415 /DNA_ID=CAMNT_0020690799 /DNA_START=168 /DNA_END=1415 /DNA_ORIENTATION=-